MAYGARLESVLGASPRGFESPILRRIAPESLRFRGFSLFSRVLGPCGVSGWGLKDKTCWFDGDFSAVWCGKVGVEVGCFIV